MLKPAVAIEVGTARGVSLERISAHSQVVHAFDLVRLPELTHERFPSVEFHIGDSHEHLPRVLEQLTADGTNVDFALVDGDHSAFGVQRDVNDLLASHSVRQTTILIHDTLNERVRSGLAQIDFDAFDKVLFVDLDFVQGRVMQEGPHKDELWWGLGVVVVGPEFDGATWPQAYDGRDVYDVFSQFLVAGGRINQRLGHSQTLELEAQVARERELVGLMEGSWSWRLTSPLRNVKQLARRLTGRG